MMGEASDHHASHRKEDQGLAALRLRFIILAQTMTVNQPDERSLHDLSSWQDHEDLVIVAAQHWLQEKTAMHLNPLRHVSARGSIDLQATQLFLAAWKAREEYPGSGRIGHARRYDADGQQQPRRIDERMTSATFDVFPAVSPRTSSLHGLHALAVQCSGRRMHASSRLSARRRRQRVMNLLPGAISAQATKGGGDDLPGRILFWQHAPSASGI
jgi:hypothetical protein